MTSPFGPILSALATDNPATLYAIGDSTDYGEIDAEWFTKYGWPGRLGIDIGVQYDVNVVLRVFQKWTGNGTSSVGGVTGPSTYAPAVSIHTTARVGAPTLTIRLGGWPGGIMSNYIANASAMLPTTANAAVVVIYSGYNETSATTYASNLGTFINSTQSLLPGVPIVVCNQHQTTISHKSGGIFFASLFNASLQLLMPGATRPISPALQPSTTRTDVWYMDTLQAPVGSDGINPDGIHPNATGYDVIEAWMIDIVSPGGGPGTAPEIVTDALGSLSVNEEFTEELAVTGTTPIAWAVQAGVLPTGLSLDATSGVISGTPTVAASYDFTARATNDYGHADKQYTGVVHSIAVDLFNPNTIVRFKVKLNGYWHSVMLKIKDEGVWKPVMLRS